MQQQMERLFVIVLLAFALTGVAAQISLSIGCVSCSSAPNGACLQLQGGPFNNYLYPAPNNLNCSGVQGQTLNFNFGCNVSCS
jgi:hypothetical protein